MMRKMTHANLQPFQATIVLSLGHWGFVTEIEVTSSCLLSQRSSNEKAFAEIQPRTKFFT